MAVVRNHQNKFDTPCNTLVRLYVASAMNTRLTPGWLSTYSNCYNEHESYFLASFPGQAAQTKNLEIESYHLVELFIWKFELFMLKPVSEKVKAFLGIAVFIKVNFVSVRWASP